MINILFVVCMIILYLFSWINQRYSYWKRKNVPQLNPKFPFGNFKKAFVGENKISVNVLMYKIYKQFRKRGYQYGGYYSFTTPVWMPVNLDLVKNIFQKDFQHFTDHAQFLFHHKNEKLSEHLFNLEGEKWKRVRSSLTPTFSSREIKIMFDIVNELGNTLEEKISRKTTVDIKEIIACFSIDVIASCVFGMDTKCMDNPDIEFRQMGKNMFAPRLFNFLIEFVLPWNLLGSLGYKSIHKSASKYFTQIMTDTIKMKQETAAQRHDFVHLLLKLRNDSFTMDDILANMLAFYAAGFETTSTTISFCLYEMSKHKHVQDKAREEVKKVLERYEGKLTYEGIQEMQYIQQCIEETLRLYPPGAAISRNCTQTYKVPNSDLVIEKGTQVIVSVLGIHRDPEYYENPLTFNPDNFSKEMKARRHQCTWMPFGEGPRQCVGVRFAFMQMKIAIACLLRSSAFTLNERTPEEVTFKPGQLTIQSNEDLILDVSKKV